MCLARQRLKWTHFLLNGVVFLNHKHFNSTFMRLKILDVNASIFYKRRKTVSKYKFISSEWPDVDHYLFECFISSKSAVIVPSVFSSLIKCRPTEFCVSYRFDEDIRYLFLLRKSLVEFEFPKYARSHTVHLYVSGIVGYFYVINVTTKMQ